MSEKVDICKYVKEAGADLLPPLLLMALTTLDQQIDTEEEREKMGKWLAGLVDIPVVPEGMEAALGEMLTKALHSLLAKIIKDLQNGKELF